MKPTESGLEFRGKIATTILRRLKFIKFRYVTRATAIDLLLFSVLNNRSNLHRGPVAQIRASYSVVHTVPIVSNTLDGARARYVYTHVNGLLHLCNVPIIFNILTTRTNSDRMTDSDRMTVISLRRGTVDVTRVIIDVIIQEDSMKRRNKFIVKNKSLEWINKCRG